MSDASRVDSFHRPTHILGHANGVVIRANVDGKDIDVLVENDARGRLLQALSHSLSADEIKSFRDLLSRQGR